MWILRAAHQAQFLINILRSVRACCLFPWGRISFKTHGLRKDLDVWNENEDFFVAGVSSDRVASCLPLVLQLFIVKDFFKGFGGQNIYILAVFWPLEGHKCVKLPWKSLLLALPWVGAKCWGRSLLCHRCLPSGRSRLQALLQLSALWLGYVLRWLHFGEPPNATESPLSALQAAARLMHVAEISSASSSRAFAWPGAPPGLLCSCSPGIALIAFTATPFKIWAKKYDEVSWCNVCCSWKGYGPG